MSMKKIITVGLFANIAEWYDFSVYAFLATTIGTLFFHSKQPKMAMITAFFLFTISYMIRPIGSIFWGYFGDHYGRKKALQWTLIIMAVPTVFIGILPIYDNVGIIATIFLILLRLVQGFASGGELPISACYIYEISPKEKRNFFCSIVSASPMIGVLFGSVIAFFIYAFFTADQIISYAWRIPFLFGFVVLFLILYIRKGLEETEEFKAACNKDNGDKKAISRKNFPNKAALLQIIALYSFIQSAFYLLFVWMPSYLEVFLLVDKRQSFLSNTIGMFSLVVLTLIVGYLANRVNYRKLVLFSVLSIGILSYPLFLLLQTKVFVIILMVQIVFAVCLSLVDGVIVRILTSSFDASTRCRGVSLGFILPSAILGGILPTLSSYLIYKTNITLIPVFFISFISFAVLPVVVKSKLM